MNLKSLQFFCEVVETGSASLAAQRLHVVPAAVSMQLAQLEDTLGGAVFDRATRPMTLTPLGHFIYPKAKALLADARRLFDEAQDMAAGRYGWLSIGFTRSTIFSVLPDAVRRMKADLPKVKVELTEILSEDQAQALRNGFIHVGLSRIIGPLAVDDDLEGIPLFDDPLIAAVPASRALARRRRLTGNDLAGLAYVSYPKDPASGFARSAIQALEHAGIKVRVGYEAKEIHTALGLVAAGLGYTLVGRSVAQDSREDILFMPIQGLGATAQVYAVRAKGVSHRLVDAFMRILEDQSIARQGKETL
ncbi:LysR family transcriptional regulator [Bordetella genomosp. 13]|uniref:LysR family transcriptional regulator n=1 Tax=Bordetella genomosp. 13 TaxID=463040 RepID=UPI0011A32EEB|nr:LysR family transcriptional regulator [Bordetella genomosp. 13]